MCTSPLPLIRAGLTALAAVCLVSAPGCSESDNRSAPRSTVQPEPPIGATTFVSAARAHLGGSYRVEAPAATGGSATDQKTIEEGDIYRVLGPGLILNLNTYRGLQVLDVTTPATPRIRGTLRVSGTPVEAYVVDDRAVVLLNGWTAYGGGSLAGLFDPAHGGVVLLVDLADPDAPKLLAQQSVDGNILTSRLTRAGANVAVYVAAYGSGAWGWAVDGVPTGGVGVATTGPGATTSSAVAALGDARVVSFRVGTDALSEAGRITLPGGVSAVQGTPDALLVGRNDWTSGQSRVSVIDIADPTGVMQARGEALVAGAIRKQFQMDLHQDILRVVTHANNTNHIETFRVSTDGDPVALDHETFGAEQELYATLFLGEKAFFVTYFRQDPLHAFEITADGDATERSAFVVSGWNDFFTALAGGSRMIGVGVDDQANQRRLAVSLYDITDLTNPTPLLARDHIDLASSWSEATWDHRAFSVLEGAVDVVAPDGTTPETGLVLLPFEGWSAEGFEAGVKLFTFSGSTLTARGTMAHPSPVRRSFLVADATAANLSDIDLSLFDTTAPDAPVELGRLAVAPNFSDLFLVGGAIARVADEASYGWYTKPAGPAPESAIEVVAPDADPDTAVPMATIPIPAGAATFQANDRLVTAQMRWESAGESPGYRTTISAYDLSSPQSPVDLGTIETDQLAPTYTWYPQPALADACFDCGWNYLSGAFQATPSGDALVFVERRLTSAPAGTRETCVTAPSVQSGGGIVVPVGPGEVVPPSGGGGAGTVEPARGGSGSGDAGTIPAEGQAHLLGRVECVRENGGAPVCTGQIYQCQWYAQACVAVDPATVETTTTCATQPFTRQWERSVLHVLDLAGPVGPSRTSTGRQPALRAVLRPHRRAQRPGGTDAGPRGQRSGRPARHRGGHLVHARLRLRRQQRGVRDLAADRGRRRGHPRGPPPVRGT